MNTAEILRAAAARVRQGWTQFGLTDGRGNVCVLGGIQAVAGYDSEAPMLAAIVFSRVLNKNVAEWNDAEDQTQENVATTLEYAALVWEQEQAAAQRINEPAVTA